MIVSLLDFHDKLAFALVDKVSFLRVIRVSNVIPYGTSEFLLSPGAATIAMDTSVNRSNN
jgi:hypothetical protein